MGQVVQFPSGAPKAIPAILATKGAAPAAPSASVVRPIRPDGRIARKNPKGDDHAIMTAKLAAAWRAKAEAAAHDPTSEDYRLAAHMMGIDRNLPRNKLRCIVSTLDERRDFDLRVVEVELASARRELAKQEHNRVRVLEGVAWWDSPVQSAMVKECERLFDLYRVAVLAMAETPARTWPQLERKVRLVGKCWLSAEGDWYDRLRTGVEADKDWLAANCPKKGRAR